MLGDGRVELEPRHRGGDDDTQVTGRRYPGGRNAPGSGGNRKETLGGRGGAGRQVSGG